MAGLIPLNSRRGALLGGGFEDFYNMLDDFFGDKNLQNRDLLKDTFKIDIKETEKDYAIEAEMPGIKREEINLNASEQVLTISVNREESVEDKGERYIHKERRTSSMSRSVRLMDAKLDEIKAKLDQGVLTITIPKWVKEDAPRRIEIE